MAEVSSPQSTASDIHLRMSGIHDLRCRGGLDDCLQCVFEGNFSYESKLLHSIVTHHVNFNCLEVVVFPDCCQPGSTSVDCGQKCEEPWGRYYIPEERIFRLISKQDFDVAMEQEKTNTRQRRRHLSFSHMIRHAKYVNVSTILQRMIGDFLNLDISRRFLEQQKLTSEILLDPIGRPLEYRRYFADNVVLLIPQPPCLVCTNVIPSSMNHSFEEFKKMSKLRPLFDIAAKRLTFSWAKTCLPHSHEILQTAAGSNIGNLAISPRLYVSASAPVRLPNLFPSHQAATTSTCTDETPSLTTTINYANFPSPMLQSIEEIPSSYIGTRVSVFLMNSAMHHHLVDSHSPSPSASNKIDACYSHSPFLNAHHTSLSSSLKTTRSFVAISAARVRWIVAIDRTIRNLLHEKIILKLQSLAANEANRLISEETVSTQRRKLGRSDSNLHEASNNNKSGMQLLRSRVLAVAALSRLKSSADNSTRALKSPVTVARSPSQIMPVGTKHASNAQETSSRTVRSTCRLPPATSPIYKSTSPNNNTISKDSPMNSPTAKVSCQSPVSPISLPSLSITQTKPSTDESSSAAMQQLRGAWLRHRQMS